MKIYISIFLLIITTFSCSKENANKTLITGNIPNLPDGTMYLFKETMLEKIDSTKVVSGKFEFKYFNKTNLPVYLGIFHIDKKNVKRVFGFPTKSKYKGSPLVQSVFMSDPFIKINGEFFDNTPNGFPEHIRSVDLKTPIKSGIQTEAFYNIDGDLFEKINAQTIQVIKEKIYTFPSSYYLLEKISENKNSFPPEQVDLYLKLFKGDITKNDLFKNLYAYNKKRYAEKNTSLPMLENLKGVKSPVLDSKYKKHLVVFWASWCGPCRQEIPLLKRIYSTKDESIEFISISIDEDKNAWKKALNQEQMNWKQMFISDKDPNYEKIQIYFKLNGAIPYTVLLDDNSKILKTTVGLSSEKDLINFIK
ncbi:TlpA disulfide reductase family protein [Chryseobacterium daeguense]|uniref:TlpA disulfide reductase family protein n=1 Tax=Chryseobacterium daeguense TaxID=412438 RepID=UPI0004188DC8|nr:TlpA disulfide reductase family protein [Chryseobacterium daeguense]